jgi:hypothetical protein
VVNGGALLWQRTSDAGFDLIYEPSDKLNHDQASLNRAYENIIKTIHDIDPQRMIFIAPRLRRAGRFNVLEIAGRSQNYLLAEWHIFPWGPLKNNGNTRGRRDGGRKSGNQTVNTAVTGSKKPVTRPGSAAGRREKPLKRAW